MPAIDSNIVYIALLVSLWLGVTATYMPGTGLLEVVAVGALIAVTAILGTMPTNWWAVIVLVLGVLIFIVIPFLKQQFVALAVGGLLLQGVGAWFMFRTGPVSPVIIGLTVVIALLYHRYALIPILERVRTQPVPDEDTSLIGATGRVVKALDPTGTVHVRGELWTATSDKNIKAGADVVVVERRGLNIYVEGLKHKRGPTSNNEE
jgi:membrane-bound serine protease (ClpP class)